MKFLSQVVNVVLFVLIPIQAINDRSKYPELSARLNCSTLVVRHQGIKTDQVQTNSIYMEPKMVASRDATLETEDEEGDDDKVSKDESTEVPTKFKDESEIMRSKRGVVRSERLWTVDNITIIDGYSKVAFYPPKHVQGLRVKRMVAKSVPVATENECTAPFDDDGSEYNWYQVMVNNGGPPGKLNATLQSPKITKVLEPCYRPINETFPPMEDLLYNYELMEFEKVHRHERAFLRFAGTASEFVDIVGHLVWSPPPSPRRYYRVSYRKDDTGLYVNVRKGHKCTFLKSPAPSVQCNRIKDFTPCEM